MAVPVKPAINQFPENIELVELHAHLGASVSPTMLWEIAHNQGLKLPTKNFWDFERTVTLYEAKPYEEYLLLHDLTEGIQSSPEALFAAAESAVSGAYRKNNITMLELRFNPILRARGGERDLDHLIVYALQGIERAMLKYPVRVGIILMLDRRFTHHENAAIVKKAIRYRERGVVGIDLAGPVKRTRASESFRPADIADIVSEARSHGLGVTIHTGEVTPAVEIWETIRALSPDRIGHGIRATDDPRLLEYLRDHHIVLETCPTSNLNTGVLKDLTQMRSVYRILKKFGVPFTINTDGPEMQRITLREEFAKLLNNRILSVRDLVRSNDIARQSSFLNGNNIPVKKYFL
ncbi:hypothetical protein A2Z33_01565 [Candidatus Gottesmanbacteria bacterium RBG_16_52_11]|uniref:adenosine deaminase n=1 Tax=Candidatus Gottesmanbacteria bacterium RBG_16_52_11 TaxID=1798374 RepID=A0A1F5YNW4_9BACT|nr:MAG: hypothetical protein A2Z33_01565 [Candidatus Gottesmanbacteria bacterium RBG_16_52_11]